MKGCIKAGTVQATSFGLLRGHERIPRRPALPQRQRLLLTRDGQTPNIQLLELLFRNVEC